MPRWALSSMTWADEDVYVIGGGPSLLHFRWDLLTTRRTIGCNKAYRLGSEIVKIVCFGDLKFFSDFKDDLMAFAGPVVTTCPALLHRNEPWLWTVPRMTRGLGTNALGWNGSTGAMAINLALALGGKRVFLLGFDMGLVDGRSHWHEGYGGRARSEVYVRFMEGMGHIAHALPKVFPGREVVTVADQTRLTAFPIVGMAEHFGCDPYGKESKQ